MSDQLFATRWDFLFATVLIGVDRTTGVYSGNEPTPGQQMVCVWTTTEIAEDSLHVESWELRPIAVRELVAMLPDGIGVVVDPERPGGMTASPAYVSALRQVLDPFPADQPLRVAEWEELTGSAREAVVAAAADVRELHAFTYRVDDSPPLGCLAVVADQLDVAVAALEDALGAPAELGVATVRVVPLTAVPAEVLTAVGDAFRIVPPRRRSRWRR